MPCKRATLRKRLTPSCERTATGGGRDGRRSRVVRLPEGADAVAPQRLRLIDGTVGRRQKSRWRAPMNRKEGDTDAEGGGKPAAVRCLELDQLHGVPDTLGNSASLVQVRLEIGRASCRERG